MNQRQSKIGQAWNVIKHKGTCQTEMEKTRISIIVGCTHICKKEIAVKYSVKWEESGDR